MICLCSSQHLFLGASSSRRSPGRTMENLDAENRDDFGNSYHVGGWFLRRNV